MNSSKEIIENELKFLKHNLEKAKKKKKFKRS